MANLNGQFDEGTLYVNIKGRTLLMDTNIVDLPGRPPGDDASKVLNMIKTWTSQPNTVALVLTSFEVTGDRSYDENILTKLGDFFNSTKNGKSEAILICSRMDKFINDPNFSLERLQYFIGVAEEKGFKKENIIFLSLLPSGNESDYAQIPAQESVLMKQLVNTIGESDVKFGISSATEMMNEIVISNVRNSSKQGIHSTLANYERSILTIEADLQGEPIEDVYIKCRHQFLLLIHTLVGLATNDYEAISSGVEIASKKFRDQIDRGWKPSEIIKKAGRSLAEERQAASQAMKLDSLDFMNNATVTNTLNMKMPGTQQSHALASRAEMRLSSETAVKRLLQIFGLALMTRPLHTFTEEEIVNLTGLLDGNNVQSFSTPQVIRKMVNEMRIDEASVECFIDWCVFIYKSLTRLVCEEMKSVSKLLENYPMLEEEVNKRFINGYSERLDMYGENMKTKAREILKRRWNHLRIGELGGIIHLLSCSKLNGCLVQNQVLFKNQNQNRNEITMGQYTLVSVFDYFSKVTLILVVFLCF